MAVRASLPRRLALLIATSRYSDSTLTQLRSPGHDVRELADALGNPLVGGFSVQTLIDAPYGVLLETIEGFCADGRVDDQLLIYLSCHGVLDERGRLYYAVTDTRRNRIAATAIGAAWLNERLDDSRVQHQRDEQSVIDVAPAAALRQESCKRIFHRARDTDRCG